MKNSLSALVAGLVLVACGTAKQSSTSADKMPRPVHEKKIFSCVTNNEKDNLKVDFFHSVSSEERDVSRAELFAVNKDSKNLAHQLIRDLNVCTTEDHGSIITSICHDVNFTDTYTVTLDRSGWFPSASAVIAYVSEVNPFEAKMTCTVVE
ncbi:MAG: hypothetical protein AB7T49_17510 [Oligoflexales bacterium]